MLSIYKPFLAEIPLVAHLVSRANPEDLMLLYGLPTFPKGDVNAFISGIARSQQLVRKVGPVIVSSG